MQITSGSTDLADLFRRALALHQSHDLAGAEALYRAVLDAVPRHADALHLLGVIAAQKGQPREAISLIGAAIAEAPDSAVMHANLGRANKAAGQTHAALAAFERAIALGSTDPGVFNDRGNVLLDLDRAGDALHSFEHALALQPDYADALCNRGNVLRALNRNQAALDSFNQAIVLRPDFADAFSNRGNLLQDLDRHAEAVTSYSQALAVRPDHIDALVNRGVALRAIGQYDAARASYDAGLALRPDHAALHANRGLLLLQTGDYPQGWAEHEWRLRLPTFADRANRFAQPAWHGEEDIAGKTMFLHAEQGFGDTLQFFRYAALVAARGARVVLEVGRPLARLLATAEGVAQVICGSDPLPQFDLHCPLLSLPFAFGTTLETISRPAQLRIDPAELEARRQRIAALSGKRIGLVWEGSSLKRHPEGRAIDRRRSITLAQLAPLRDSKGVSFVSLQVGAAAVQTASPPQGLIVHDFTADLTDFAATAALIANLDLVICVDTAVAHLAGSLGKPVWILTQFDSDWRWLLNRTDSPWYPSARLFRQRSFGDWDGVITDVAAALDAFT